VALFSYCDNTGGSGSTTAILEVPTASQPGWKGGATYGGSASRGIGH